MAVARCVSPFLGHRSNDVWASAMKSPAMQLAHQGLRSRHSARSRSRRGPDRPGSGPIFHSGSSPSRTSVPRPRLSAVRQELPAGGKRANLGRQLLYCLSHPEKLEVFSVATMASGASWPPATGHSGLTLASGASAGPTLRVCPPALVGAAPQPAPGRLRMCCLDGAPASKAISTATRTALSS